MKKLSHALLPIPFLRPTMLFDVGPGPGMAAAKARGRRTSTAVDPAAIAELFSRKSAEPHRLEEIRLGGNQILSSGGRKVIDFVSKHEGELGMRAEASTALEDDTAGLWGRRGQQNDLPHPLRGMEVAKGSSTQGGSSGSGGAVIEIVRLLGLQPGAGGPWAGRHDIPPM